MRWKPMAARRARRGGGDLARGCFNQRLREVGGGAGMLHAHGIEEDRTGEAMAAVAAPSAEYGKEGNGGDSRLYCGGARRCKRNGDGWRRFSFVSLGEDEGEKRMWPAGGWGKVRGLWWLDDASL